ncbi:uncharacterized protein LOC117653999 [Thrips palmi]|uniref:Uncharacterized protein LOC117653999 n=1 Tax=Thrips palmi TaxID=161013 RepID=A0A6P9ACT5_THRPL|nr:uncharacterized protein LOC117653999 [Thrips palmi]
MARNYEKNFGRLNRLWLEKTKGKKEKRPRLSTLKTSEEISCWLPSIKDELDFFLKQTEVPCYTERKIDECRKHISCLEAEYKAFVRKLHQLNSGLKTTPWLPRPYEKKTCVRSALSLHPSGADLRLGQISSIQTPVLMHDTIYQEDEVETELLETDIHCQSNNEMLLFSNSTIFTNQCPQRTIEQKMIIGKESFANNESGVSSGTEPHRCADVSEKNPLGLDYSSSDDES